MGTIAENLLTLEETKQNIKTAIQSKGQDLTDVPFTQYADKISEIQTGGGTDKLQWICDNVKKLKYTFQGYKGTDLGDILRGLDTSQVTDMEYMLNSCTNFTENPNYLNTSNVTNFSNTFAGCAFTEFTGLDTSNVTNMTRAFNSCKSLITIELNMIKASNVTLIFNSCVNLTNVTLSNIVYSLQIGSGTTYGQLITLDSLVNTIKELWDNSSGTSTRTLTLSTASKELIADVYVKLVDVTDEMLANDPYVSNKKPCVVCESTDEGAMTLTEYAVSKKWSIA